MKRMSFTVPFYDVRVRLYQIESPSDAPEIRRVLAGFNVDKDITGEIVSGVERGAVNGGETFRNFRRKMMVIIFYEWDSEEKKIEVLEHEKRHVEDRILEYNGVHDIESAGLLAGFLGVKFFKFAML